MNSSNDAAEQVVNLSLRGLEVAAKITGEGAKNLAVYLYAVLKEQKKTKGKARLTTMLKSGKELKLFAVKNEDLPLFLKEAKKYGLMYCALYDKKGVDGMTDVMVKAESGAIVNRIFEKYKLASVDMAAIKTEITKAKGKETLNPTRQKAIKNQSVNLSSNKSISGEASEKPSVRDAINNIKKTKVYDKEQYRKKNKNKVKTKGLSK